jgi:signal transduction histidine kinase
MRVRAQAISASTPSTRLPQPPGRDEIARLAETLNAMLGRLQAAVEHERRFVADASHELRTPLALLRTELELALRRPRTREALEDALRSASQETERLTRLAEDLLLIARSDAGELPVRREPVPAAEVLEVVAQRFGGVAAERGRTLELVPPDGIVLDADPTRLEQALGNLVDNALAHGRGRILLSAEPRGELVALHVEDEGPGFPAGFLDDAFQRFSRPDQSRSGSGSGLGLSIVDLIAEAHGGSAGARNRAEGGADVWIAVPRES